MAEENPIQKKSKRKAILKALRIAGFALFAVLLAALTVNSLLCVFADHYYPTFGEYRLFAIVTDSMEPEIPAGDMIVGRVPGSAEEITEGAVITYELRQGNGIVLITHRVSEVLINAETGEVSYLTKGDNAPYADTVRPAYSDVVGIYTGNRCGFFGYFFGFLQSAEGAVALIIILLIAGITLIIVHFVNLVTVWRKVALEALKKSGAILSDTQIEELGTIADVIGIVSKEPLDKTDIRRKDKKLHWFIKTGALPRRPYNDDLDVSQLPNGELNVSLPKLVRIDDLQPVLAETHGETLAGLSEEVAEEETVAAAEESGLTPAMIRERHETMSYTFSFSAKIIQLKPQAKEWYSRLKNELLSYGKVRVRMGNRYESFLIGRRTVARLTVRGKTLCILLAADPVAYEGSKFNVEPNKTNTPCLYRIKNDLRVRYACKLIEELMAGSGVQKRPDYEPQDYYQPYEGLVSLMNKGLVKRNLNSSEKAYRIVEIEEEPDRGAAAAPEPEETVSGEERTS